MSVRRSAAIVQSYDGGQRMGEDDEDKEEDEFDDEDESDDEDDWNDEEEDDE